MENWTTPLLTKHYNRFNKIGNILCVIGGTFFILLTILTPYFLINTKTKNILKNEFARIKAIQHHFNFNN